MSSKQIAIGTLGAIEFLLKQNIAGASDPALHDQGKRYLSVVRAAIGEVNPTGLPPALVELPDEGEHEDAPPVDEGSHDAPDPYREVGMSTK